jgi:hypothetical protein
LIRLMLACLKAMCTGREETPAVSQGPKD